MEMYFRNGAFCLILMILLFSPCGLFGQERTHVVSSGDTIFSIARTFNVDRDELMRVNGITDPTRLRVGQRLTIPGASGTSAAGGQPANIPAENITYRAVQGDTFYGIARRYGISVNELLQANNLSANHVLRQGDMLRIPGTAAAAAPAPAATPQTPSAARAETTRTAVLDASVRWPVSARELSYMIGNSNGVIITGDRSEPVRSLSAGTVISAGPYRGYGHIAIVQAANGYIYVYGGCETLTVKEGDRVGPGMEMGRLGIDPITQKPQLFFRVYQNNTPVDPAKAPRA